jgi:hypothetical protein
VNTAPTATAQSVSTNENVAKSITLAGTDTETLPANLSFNVTANPAHGTLTGTAPNLTYNPDPGYFGPDTFQFTVTDRGRPDNCGAPGSTCAPSRTSSAALVAVTVVPVNTAPAANAQSVVTTTNSPVGVTLTGSDAETPAGSLIFTITTNPGHGSLTGTAPNLTFTPTAGFAGLDSFKFMVTDRGKPDNCGAPSPSCAAALDSVVATVSITVNQPPAITSANNVTFAPGKPGQSFTVQTTGFPSGASMVIGETGPLPAGVTFTDNNNGTATIAGTPAAATQGSLGNPVSQGYPLTVTANNSINPQASQSFTLNIACPVITVSGTTSLNLTYNIPANSTYTQSGGNATIVWSASGLPTNLSINASTGAITGTPNVTGTYSATVRATDAGGCVGTMAVTVAVGPNLLNQSYTGVGNTQLFVSGVSGAPMTPAVQNGTTLLTGATPAGSVLITGANCTTGGSIMGTDGAGRFIFTPDVGAASATCTYTAASNTGVGSTGPATAIANLTFTLTNKVWYVNHGSSGGDGRSNSPFADFGAGANQLNCVNTSNGDYIYVHTGAANTAGACALKAGQSLIGAGAALAVGNLSISATANYPMLTGTLTLANSVTVNGLDLSTGTATAISGTSATGVSVTPRNVATTTGIAVNIGGSGNTGTYSFKSIWASGASSGISLSNMMGSFTVTGDGNTSVGGNSSGGIIQNTSAHGISLTNVQNVSLTNMNIHDNARSGIYGQQVTNFTFQNGRIDNVGTAAAGQYEESNIAFNDGGTFTSSSLSGTVSITGSLLTNARRHGIQIENGSGTISNLTITNNNLTSSTSASSSLGTAILIFSGGSAGTTSHVTTGTISGNSITNFPSSEGIAVLGGSGNGSNNTPSTLGANGTPIVISNNTIGGQSAAASHMGSNAIHVAMNSQIGVMNMTISCNGNTTSGCTATGPITNIQGQGVSVFAGGSITGTTTIDRNVIIANQTLGAGTQGLGVQVDDGPAASGTSAADYNFIVTNNSVSNYEGNGIRAIARASLGTMDLTIQNNTVSAPGLLSRNGIRVDSGSAAGNVTTCLLMTGNTSAGSGVMQGMGIRKQGTVSTTNAFGIVGLAPSPTTGAKAAEKITADNPSGNGTDAISGDNFVSCTITP